MANPGQRREAFPAFHFEVDIGGTAYPFRSCGGLKAETKVVEMEEGGCNGYVHKLVGQSTFPPLVLRQGFADASSPLFKMYRSFVADGCMPGFRFNGYVRQIGPNGTEAKWIFRRGWISKWEGPDLDATRNEVSIEAIEISHEGLDIIGGSLLGGALGFSFNV